MGNKETYQIVLDDLIKLNSSWIERGLRQPECIAGSLDFFLSGLLFQAPSRWEVMQILGVVFENASKGKKYIDNRKDDEEKPDTTKPI